MHCTVPEIRVDMRPNRYRAMHRIGVLALFLTVEQEGAYSAEGGAEGVLRNTLFFFFFFLKLPFIQDLDQINLVTTWGSAPMLGQLSLTWICWNYCRGAQIGTARRITSVGCLDALANSAQKTEICSIYELWFICRWSNWHDSMHHISVLDSFSQSNQKVSIT